MEITRHDDGKVTLTVTDDQLVLIMQGLYANAQRIAEIPTLAQLDSDGHRVRECRLMHEAIRASRREAGLSR